MTVSVGEYDVFISYARKDNRPIGAAPEGWVSAVVRLIQEDQLRFGRPFRIFMDTSEITLRQDWEQRLRGALRTSKVLIVFVSPNYFASQPCRWEWEEHLLRRERLQSQFGWDADDDRPEQAVFLVETPASDHAETEAWRAQVMATHGVEIRDWFADGASEAQLEQVRESIAALGSSTFERVQLARTSAATLGNVRSGTEYFVGRTEPMRMVREALTGAYSLGVVTAVHSLGGLGKTELAVMYANSNRGKYAGGVWMVGAEGQSSLYAVLAQLASVPAFGLAVEPGQGAEAVGELVWHRLRTSATPERKALVVLDNVSDPALLSPEQLAPLGLSGLPDVHLLATTRLGPTDFPASRSSLGFISLPTMSEEEGLALIAMHLPGGHFRSTADGEAARALLADLGGLTLAIEQVAVFLAMNPDVEVRSLHEELRRNGLRSLDAMLDDAAASGAILHQGKTLDAVLRTTLAGLDPVSISVLCLAACLPPDEIPWAWLRTMAAALHPTELGGESLSAQTAWGRTKRLLLSRNLLTDSDIPGIVRMHRLVSEWLRSHPDHPTAAAVVFDHMVSVAEGLHHGATTTAHECSALASAIAACVAADAHVAARFNIPGLFYRLPHYVSDGRPLSLAQGVLRAAASAAMADPGNRGAQRDLTISLTNVAGILQFSDPAAALAHYQQSLTITRQLADTDPGNRDAQRDLTVSLTNVAGILKFSDPAAALAHYQQSLTITRQLADTDPGNRDAQRDLTVSLDNVAGILKFSDPAAALAHYQQSLTIRRQLADTDPGNRDAQRDLTISLTNVAGILQFSDPAAALAHYQQSLTITRQLADTDPGNRDAQRDLTVSLTNVAGILQFSDPAAALAHYQQSLTITRQLADTDPGNRDAQRDLTVSLTNVAGILKFSDPAAALAHYQQSLTITRQLADTDPGNRDAQRDLTVSLDNVAGILQFSDPAAALAHYQQSLTIRRQLADTDPGNRDAQRDLTVSLTNVAGILKFSDPAAALAHYQQSLTITRQLADTDPGNRDAQRDLTVSLTNVAGILKFSDPAAALAHYQQSLTIRRQLADTDPGNRDAQRDLTVSLNNVAGILQFSDPAAALAHYQQSLTITRQLADTDPGNLQGKRDVMVTLMAISSLAHQVGLEDAPDLAREAVSLAEELAARRQDRATYGDLATVLKTAIDVIEASAPDEAAAMRERQQAVQAALDAN